MSVNNSGLLNNTGLNCKGLLRHGFFFFFFQCICTVLYHLWLVDSGTADMDIAKGSSHQEGIINMNVNMSNKRSSTGRTL